MKNYCDECKGSGRVYDPRGPIYTFWKRMDCPICEGTGEIQPPKNRPMGLPPLPPPVPPSREIGNTPPIIAKKIRTNDDDLKAMDKIEIKFVGNLKKLQLSKGDVLVLQMDQAISPVAFKTLEDYMAKMFPKNQTVILEEGIKLGALSTFELKKEILDWFYNKFGNIDTIPNRDYQQLLTEIKSILNKGITQ